MKLYKTTLDKLGFVGRGKSKHRPRNDKSLFGGDFPFIQTGEVKAVNLYITSFKETYNDKGLAQSKLWKKGTLLITIAANIAETAILKIDACFPDSIVAFIPYENTSDVKYVKYYLDYIKRELQAISQGTTQDNMSLGKLLSRTLYVPDYLNQKKIANILSAYDDLIENNNQRIQLLEEMAAEIYKEWFVRFRFPSYESATFVDKEGKEVPHGTDGALPLGWERVRFDEIINLISGFAFKSTDFTKEKNTEVTVRMGNFRVKGGLQFRTNIKYLKNSVTPKSKYKLVAGDMLIVLSDVTRGGAIIGNVGLIPKDENNYYLNQRVSKIESAPYLKYYLYSYFNSIKFKNYCLAHADSATVLNLSNSDLYKHKIVIPRKEIISSFEKMIIPILKECTLLDSKNKTLQQTRDLLLPRLISGKLSVENLVLPTEEANLVNS